MSASTRSYARSVSRFALALVTAFAAGATYANEPAWCGRAGVLLPDQVARTAPGLELRGEGQLRWFGILAYRARLWAAGAAATTTAMPGPLALEIQYARRFRGEQLATRSVDEMRGAGLANHVQLRAWGTSMARVFRDVHEGDCVLGVLRSDGSTQFLLNDTPIGVIDDREFGRAFFGIWLAPSTSQPALRRQLLGEAK